jgi:hypothetical protein
VQAGRGAVYPGGGEACSDRLEHHVPSATMTSAEQAQMAFQVAGLHQPG